MDTSSDTLNGSRTIKASEFKATCLKLMDEVAETGERVLPMRSLWTERPILAII